MIKNLGERRLSWRRSVQKEEKPPPKVIYSGYLTKQGSIVKNWKKRWFVLTDDSELSYWIDESLEKKKGSLNIRETYCGPTPWENPKDKISGELFAIQTPHRTYLLLAESKSVLSHWKKIFVQYGARWASIDSLIPLNKTRNSNVISKYNLTDELGRGGFSIVYRALLKERNEAFAIKIIDKTNLIEEDLMILAREVEIAKLFQHVNILKLKEYYDSCEESTFVYELIPDGELFDYLAKLRKISELETCGIIWQVLQGISCMHEKGIVHRDLKLENLLCSKQEKFVPFRIVIADFGFSKNFKSSILKTACGTLDYAAPELLLAETYTEKVDMWSIGVICFFLLCGELPFEGKTQGEIIERIVNQQYSFSDAIWSSISVEGRDFISKLLLKNPKERFSPQQGLKHHWFSKHQHSLPQMSLPIYSVHRGSFRSPAPPPGVPPSLKQNLIKQDGGEV